MSDADTAQSPPQNGVNGDHGPAQHSRGPRDQNAMFLRAARAGNREQVLQFIQNGVDINTSNTNGLNALHLASKEGHVDVVRELIHRGAHVDAATRKGNTALHIASLAGQDIIVTILVENGANVNAQSLNGFTPLYMAAQENHETVVRYLLAHGANQTLATEDGFTPLAVALQQGHDRIVALLLENDSGTKVKLPALHIAAKKDDTRAATLLLQSEQNPNVTSKSGFTPLHIAAHYGNENIAQLLIEKGANVNYQARHNISPLHVAAKWGRTSLATLLLSRGAIIDCRTRDLLTPLHCAARSGHDQVVDLLLEKGAPIGAKTKNGLAALHMAAQGDHVDCARILLYHRAPVDDVTVDYLTPLHVAAHCGHVRVAKLLLDRDADPNARALNGFTPLHIACKKNRIKVVELLLKYHASLEATTESGLSPLHVASFMGCINVVIYLIQQGANVDVETIRGETPLHLAARANQTDIVRVLVRNNASVNAPARELQTPLHIAARLGNTDIVHILLQAKANPNAATRDQYTPLHIAAKEGQEEVATILLDHGADKTLLNKKGFTPLHLAAKYGNYRVAKLLLERGTPVDIQGKNQVTPLHVAAHYNNDTVAQLLLENGAAAQATAKNGYTPLHIAAKKNQMDIASSLLAYKANPNAESRAGFTPLHLAAEEGHREMAALLIEHDAKATAQAKNGLTPLHLCAQEDRVEVARELLNNRAEINAQTKAGYTPLHVACHFGQLNMVRFLIENGALVSAETKAKYTPLHQAAQQGHNNVVRYLLEHGASPNTTTETGQTPLAIAQRLGYVSVVETLKTVTETTVITETTTITEERYKPHNPEAMNETMFSDSEDEVDDHQTATQEHAKDFNESITQGLRDSAMIHLIHTSEQLKSSPFDTTDADLDAVIRRAQNEPVSTAIPDSTYLDNGHEADNIVIKHEAIAPSFLISFLVDARGGAMRGCRHSGVRVIIPPRKAPAPMRVTCRYLKKEKLAHPPPLSEGEALASRILEMGPHSAKFLGPVILEVPHFASLRGREREIVILRSDDGQHWKEHQLEATEDAVQEVLNESFDAAELQQLDDLHTSRITRILTNDFPMYFAVVTRVRQEVHCVGPEGGVILSSVVPRVQAIFPDGSLTKTIKVSLQAQPVPNELVVKLHGNRVAVSPIVTVEPRRRKFHKPITLCIPLPQSAQKGMLTQYNSTQPGQEPPTLRLLCSITGGSSPAQWEDITGTTQLTFTGEEVSFTTTVSARFWLMDCQTPRDAARMAQEVYNEAISVPYMAKFVVFARRPFPVEGQLRLFCMTDDKEDKTLEKQEGFIEVAKSRDVEVLCNRHQFLEFAGNLVPISKSGEQLSVFFLPFQENRLAFNVKVRQSDDAEAATTGRIAVFKEPRSRAENIPPQHPICTLAISLPEYTGPLQHLRSVTQSPSQQQAIGVKYSAALAQSPSDSNLAELPIDFVAKRIGPDWPRLGRALQLPDSDIRQIKREYTGTGQEPLTILKIWVHLKSTEATVPELNQALRRIGRDDIVHKLNKHDVDSEGDSLRLIDTSNLNLTRSNFSSKGSLGAAAQEPEKPVATTITRTERYVHPSDEGVPVVDERTTVRVYQDNAQVEEKVEERSALPLNEEEDQKWREPVRHPEEEEERIFENSRGAMISETVERSHDGVVRTTTLVTTHVVPETQVDQPVTEDREKLETQAHVAESVPVVEEPQDAEASTAAEQRAETESQVSSRPVSTADSVIENPPRADSPREWLSRHVSPPGSPSLGRQQEEEKKVAAEDTERSPSSEARGYEGEAEETEGLTADGRSLIAGAIASNSNETAEQQQRTIEDIPLPLAELETPDAAGGEPEKEQPPPPSEEIAALPPVEAVQSEREQEESARSPEEFKESSEQEAAIQPEEQARDAPVESQERPIEQALVGSDIVAEPPPTAGAFLSTEPPLGEKPEGEPIFVHDSAVTGAKESPPQSATVNTSVAAKFASSFATSATDSATVEAAKTTKLAPVEQDSRRLASLLLSLGRMRAADPPKYTSILERLEQLEKELGALNVVPPDPALSELVGQILTSDYPNSDLQIIVSTSRKTTTSKQFYETETPGMVGLAPEQLQDLQRKLMAKISSPDDTVFGTVGSENGGPTSALPAGAVQKKEVIEDGFATNDGNEVVSKKMTRVVTTSQSAVSGAEGREGREDELVETSSIGSVRDRIAVFESLKDQVQAQTPPRRSPSVTSTTSSTHSVVQRARRTESITEVSEEPSVAAPRKSLTTSETSVEVVQQIEPETEHPEVADRRVSEYEVPASYHEETHEYREGSVPEPRRESVEEEVSVSTDRRVSEYEVPVETHPEVGQRTEEEDVYGQHAPEDTSVPYAVYGSSAVTALSPSGVQLMERREDVPAESFEEIQAAAIKAQHPEYTPEEIELARAQAAAAAQAYDAGVAEPERPKREVEVVDVSYSLRESERVTPAAPEGAMLIERTEEYTLEMKTPEAPSGYETVTRQHEEHDMTRDAHPHVVETEEYRTEARMENPVSPMKEEVLQHEERADVERPKRDGEDIDVAYALRGSTEVTPAAPEGASLIERREEYMLERSEQLPHAKWETPEAPIGYETVLRQQEEYDLTRESHPDLVETEEYRTEARQGIPASPMKEEEYQYEERIELETTPSEVAPTSEQDVIRSEGGTQQKESAEAVVEAEEYSHERQPKDEEASPLGAEYPPDEYPKTPEEKLHYSYKPEDIPEVVGSEDHRYEQPAPQEYVAIPEESAAEGQAEASSQHEISKEERRPSVPEVIESEEYQYEQQELQQRQSVPEEPEEEYEADVTPQEAPLDRREFVTEITDSEELRHELKEIPSPVTQRVEEEQQLSTAKYEEEHPTAEDREDQGLRLEDLPPTEPLVPMDLDREIRIPPPSDEVTPEPTPRSPVEAQRVEETLQRREEIEEEAWRPLMEEPAVTVTAERRPSVEVAPSSHEAYDEEHAEEKGPSIPAMVVGGAAALAAGFVSAVADKFSGGDEEASSVTEAQQEPEGTTSYEQYKEEVHMPAQVAQEEVYRTTPSEAESQDQAHETLAEERQPEREQRQAFDEEPSHSPHEAPEEAFKIPSEEEASEQLRQLIIEKELQQPTLEEQVTAEEIPTKAYETEERIAELPVHAEHAPEERYEQETREEARDEPTEAREEFVQEDLRAELDHEAKTPEEPPVQSTVKITYEYEGEPYEHHEPEHEQHAETTTPSEETVPEVESPVTVRIEHVDTLEEQDERETPTEEKALDEAYSPTTGEFHEEVPTRAAEESRLAAELPGKYEEHAAEEPEEIKARRESAETPEEGIRIHTEHIVSDQYHIERPGDAEERKRVKEAETGVAEEAPELSPTEEHARAEATKAVEEPLEAKFEQRHEAQKADTETVYRAEGPGSESPTHEDDGTAVPWTREERHVPSEPEQPSPVKTPSDGIGERHEFEPPAEDIETPFEKRVYTPETLEEEEHLEADERGLKASDVGKMVLGGAAMLAAGLASKVADKFAGIQEGEQETVAVPEAGKPSEAAPAMHTREHDEATYPTAPTEEDRQLTTTTETESLTEASIESPAKEIPMSAEEAMVQSFHPAEEHFDVQKEREPFTSVEHEHETEQLSPEETTFLAQHPEVLEEASATEPSPAESEAARVEAEESPVTVESADKAASVEKIVSETVIAPGREFEHIELELPNDTILRLRQTSETYRAPAGLEHVLPAVTIDEEFAQETGRPEMELEFTDRVSGGTPSLATTSESPMTPESKQGQEYYISEERDEGGYVNEAFNEEAKGPQYEVIPEEPVEEETEVERKAEESETLSTQLAEEADQISTAHEEDLPEMVDEEPAEKQAAEPVIKPETPPPSPTEAGLQKRSPDESAIPYAVVEGAKVEGLLPSETELTERQEPVKVETPQEMSPSLARQLDAVYGTSDEAGFEQATAAEEAEQRQDAEEKGPSLPQMVLGGAAMLAAGLASKVADQFTRADEHEGGEGVAQSEPTYGGEDATYKTQEADEEEHHGDQYAQAHVAGVQEVPAKKLREVESPEEPHKRPETLEPYKSEAELAEDLEHRFERDAEPLESPTKETPYEVETEPVDQYVDHASATAEAQESPGVIVSETEVPPAKHHYEAEEETHALPATPADIPHTDAEQLRPSEHELEPPSYEHEPEAGSPGGVPEERTEDRLTRHLVEQETVPEAVFSKEHDVEGLRQISTSDEPSALTEEPEKLTLADVTVTQEEVREGFPDERAEVKFERHLVEQETVPEAVFSKEHDEEEPQKVTSTEEPTTTTEPPEQLTMADVTVTKEAVREGFPDEHTEVRFERHLVEQENVPEAVMSKEQVQQRSSLDEHSATEPEDQSLTLADVTVTEPTEEVHIGKAARKEAAEEGPYEAEVDTHQIAEQLKETETPSPEKTPSEAVSERHGFEPAAEEPTFEKHLYAPETLEEEERLESEERGLKASDVGKMVLGGAAMLAVGLASKVADQFKGGESAEHEPAAGESYEAHRVQHYEEEAHHPMSDEEKQHFAAAATPVAQHEPPEAAAGTPEASPIEDESLTTGIEHAGEPATEGRTLDMHADMERSHTEESPETPETAFEVETRPTELKVPAEDKDEAASVTPETPTTVYEVETEPVVSSEVVEVSKEYGAETPVTPIEDLQAFEGHEAVAKTPEEPVALTPESPYQTYEMSELASFKAEAQRPSEVLEPELPYQTSERSERAAEDFVTAEHEIRAEPFEPESPYQTSERSERAAEEYDVAAHEAHVVPLEPESPYQTSERAERAAEDFGVSETEEQTVQLEPESPHKTSERSDRAAEDFIAAERGSHAEPLELESPYQTSERSERGAEELGVSEHEVHAVPLEPESPYQTSERAERAAEDIDAAEHFDHAEPFEPESPYQSSERSERAAEDIGAAEQFDHAVPLEPESPYQSSERSERAAEDIGAAEQFDHAVPLEPESPYQSSERSERAEEDFGAVERAVEHAVPLEPESPYQTSERAERAAEDFGTAAHDEHEVPVEPESPYQTSERSERAAEDFAAATIEERTEAMVPESPYQTSEASERADEAFAEARHAEPQTTESPYQTLTQAEVVEEKRELREEVPPELESPYQESETSERSAEGFAVASEAEEHVPESPYQTYERTERATDEFPETYVQETVPESQLRKHERTDELESQEAPERKTSPLVEEPYQLPEVGERAERHEVEAEYQHEEELVPESPYHTSERGERAEEGFPQKAETPMYEAEALEKHTEEAHHEIESEAVERYAGDIIDTAHREVIREEVEEAQYETELAATATIAKTEEEAGSKPEDEAATHKEQPRPSESTGEVPDAMTRSVYEPENGTVSIEEDEESAKAELLAEGEAKDEFDAEVKSYEADMAVSEAPEELCLIGEAGEVAQAKRARDEGQQAELPEESKPENTTRYGIYIPDSQSVEELPKAREEEEEPFVAEPPVHAAGPVVPFSEEDHEEAKHEESRPDEAGTEGTQIKTTYRGDFEHGTAEESFTPEEPIDSPEKESTGPSLPQMVLGGAAMLAAGLASKVADQFTRGDELEEHEAERTHAAGDAVKSTYEEENGRRDTTAEKHDVDEAKAEIRTEKPETSLKTSESESEHREASEELSKTTYEDDFGREEALAQSAEISAPVLDAEAQIRESQEETELQDASEKSPTVEIAVEESHAQIPPEADVESEANAKQRYERETPSEMSEGATEEHIVRLHEEGMPESVPEEPYVTEEKSHPTPEPFELQAESSLGARQPSEEAIYRPESAEEKQAAGVERERTEESLGGFDLLDEPKPEPVLTLSPEESPRHEPTEVRDERMVDLMIASTYGELAESAESELSEAPLKSPRVPGPTEEEPVTLEQTKEDELRELEERSHEEGQTKPTETEELSMPKEEQAPIMHEEERKEHEMTLPVQAAEETELVESDEVSPEEGTVPKLSVTTIAESPADEEEEEALQAEKPVSAVEDYAKPPTETNEEQMQKIHETEEADIPQRTSPDDESYEMVEQRDVELSPTEMSEVTDATTVQRKSPTSEDEFYMVVASEEDLRKNLPAESAADVTAESLVRSVIDSLEGDLTAEKIEEPEYEDLTKEARGEELPEETTQAETTLKESPESETGEDYRGFEKISGGDEVSEESTVTEEQLPSAPEGFEKVSEVSVSFREEPTIETPEPTKPFIGTPEPAESAKDTPDPDEYRDSPLLLRQRSEALLGLSGMEHTDSPKPHGDLLPTAEAPEYEEESGFQVVESEEVVPEEQAPPPTGPAGLMPAQPTFRPKSPIPPKMSLAGFHESPLAVESPVEEEKPTMEEELVASEDVGDRTSMVIERHRKSDEISEGEGSLQEFERLELEIQKQELAKSRESYASSNGEDGSPTAAEKLAKSETGSVSSLTEFEQLEREIMVSAATGSGGGASVEDVMILSDIREESEEAEGESSAVEAEIEDERMSTREDDEVDSLSGDKPVTVEMAYPTPRAIDDRMITSIDSLEAVSAAVAQSLLETSVDSLEPHPDHTSIKTGTDSLLEGVSQENQSQDTQVLSGDTVATYQEYQDDDDRDSLGGVLESYPTTLTTFETVREKEDGTTETITRRVLTREHDPVRSHIRFTGTENEDQLANINEGEPVQSVDAEGNITTIMRRHTPTLP